MDDGVPLKTLLRSDVVELYWLNYLADILLNEIQHIDGHNVHQNPNLIVENGVAMMELQRVLTII
jgi:hypothetical protein